MSSRIFHLSSKQPEIVCKIFPPIQLNSEAAVIGLTHFQVYNSIPNVDSNNNVFTYQDNVNKPFYDIVIPEGTYELADIESFLKLQLGEENVYIKPNINTLKCDFFCKYNVDFTKKNSIGQLFGISYKKYLANSVETSSIPIQISRINTIQIELNIVSGSYVNGLPTNCLYKCFISTPPGYRIVESPNNPIYLPVNTTEIDILHLKLTDERGNLINLRNEEFTIELHLKL
uniref:Uncharacterized protein n=1 Tax=Cacopsylla melanoneura TaxID=428564 RepID=A0A8D8T5B6_9HEMI